MSLHSWGGFGGSLPEDGRQQRFDHPFGPLPAQDAQVQLDRGGLRDPADGDGASLAAAAAHGVGGPAVDLPYRDRIQASFGRHDVGRVQAHVGGAAEQAADAMGAEAFATGDHAGFAGPPTLRTAAHEAAHVVQQRAGVQLAGGVGAPGDTHEQHADQVADRVVAGQSAEELLDQVQPGAAPATATSGPVQLLVKRFKPKSGGSVDQLEQIAGWIDGFTTEAHTNTLKALQSDNPGLMKGSVGENYYTNWMMNPTPMSTGYVIESYVTNKVKGNDKVLSQVSVGNARPDFIIRDDLGQFGVVDLTSSKEAGHVLDKDFKTSGFAYIGESLYPSIDHSNYKSSNFNFSNEDLKLIGQANERRAKATLGERLSRLKQNLGLIADQSFINPQAASTAAKAKRAVTAIKDFTDEEGLLLADELIVQTAKLYGGGIWLAKVTDLLGEVMSRYDVDESAFV
jgi:hypothetical protein